MRRARRLAAGRDIADAGTTRREFIKVLGAASASLGLPLVSDRAPAAESTPTAGDARGPRPAAGSRSVDTLFFNLSHIAPTTHYLYIARRRYKLERVQDNPQVLAQARRGNGFLHDVADDQITHYAIGVETPDDSVSLGYLTCNEMPSGYWEMTGTVMNIPKAAFRFAYLQARLLKTRGPLPLSIKRRRYGVQAARTLRDLEDEAVFIDPTTFASSIVGVHPDILSVEPTSAAHIYTKYVSIDQNTQNLAFDLGGMGPAIPEGTASSSALPPWATLKIVMNDSVNPPVPYKKSNGLNVYYPDWNSQVDRDTALAVQTIHPKVRNDPVLGLDVTGYNLNDPADKPAAAARRGKLWAHHDGMPTVAQTNHVLPTAGPSFTFTKQSAETGLVVSDPSYQVLSNGQVAITFDNVSNWFLRWLGVWVEFIDANGNSIPTDILPPDTYPASHGPYPRAQDLKYNLFLGAVPPPLAILGIPVNPGSFSPTIRMPTSGPAAASSVRIVYTGLGFSGGPLPSPTTFDFYQAGVLLTGTFNYAVVGFFMGVGSSDGYDATTKLIVSLGGGAIAAALQTLTGGIINQASFVAGLGSFTMGVLKLLMQAFFTKSVPVLVEVAGAIYGELVEAEILDEFPVAGQIARAVAAVVGAIQLAETSIEIALSPAGYEFHFVATHSLSVTFIPDGTNGQFPQPPDPDFVLYRKVSYLFDNGTAHTLDDVEVNPAAKSIEVTFTNIPYGGQVDISIGLYMRRKSTPPGQNDWCAGYVTTGLTSNTVDHVQPPVGLSGFPIRQTKLAIDSQTQYLHSKRIQLDASGRHAWLPSSPSNPAPRWVAPPNAQFPSLGGFDCITVRQATAKQQGYVGYAWKAYSSGVVGCSAGAPGQYDQMANLNTEGGNDGTNAQNGYAKASCGLLDGVQLGYSLLTDKALNFYVDTTKTTLRIRAVALDPPAFPLPANNESFGSLNFAESTRCLLHPAGHIVSINSVKHKIEVLKLPATAQPDSVADVYNLARTCSGPGVLPGLIDTPVAAAISPDGAILVLEDGNNRIQAFDLGGNPVPLFTNQPSHYFLELDATEDNTYLDLAVEFTGYLYVLSEDASHNHRLDIYHPTQKGNAPICTTTGLNGAKIAVDFWRNLYSLNYEVLRLPNGNIPEFTEPSLSLWSPSLPATRSRRNR